MTSPSAELAKLLTVVLSVESSARIDRPLLLHNIGQLLTLRSASRRIECPMLHLWAEAGPLDAFYAKDGGPLGIWRQWAPRAHGQAMKGGHFFPEENPDDTAVLVKQFLSA